MSKRHSFAASAWILQRRKSWNEISIESTQSDVNCVSAFVWVSVIQLTVVCQKFEMAYQLLLPPELKTKHHQNEEIKNIVRSDKQTVKIQSNRMNNKSSQITFHVQFKRRCCFPFTLHHLIEHSLKILNIEFNERTNVCIKAQNGVSIQKSKFNCVRKCENLFSNKILLVPRHSIKAKLQNAMKWFSNWN